MGEYTSNANIQSRETMAAANEQQSALFRALMQQRMQGEQERQKLAQQGEQQKGLEAQKQEQAHEFYSNALDPSSPEGKIYARGGQIHDAGGASIGQDPTMMLMKHMQQQQGQQAKSLSDAYRKDVTPYENNLETNRRFQEALDLGSQVGDKTAAIYAARLGETDKARIQQGIIQAFMKSGDSAESAAKKSQNWFNGTADSALPASARNDMRALGYVHYQGAKRDFQTALDKHQQEAAYSAPAMAANGSLQSMMANAGARGRDNIANLDKRYESYQQQGGRNIEQPIAQAQTPNQGGIMGFINRTLNPAPRPQPTNTANYAGVVPPQSTGAPNLNAQDPAMAAKAARLKELRAKEAGQ